MMFKSRLFRQAFYLLLLFTVSKTYAETSTISCNPLSVIDSSDWAVIPITLKQALDYRLIMLYGIDSDLSAENDQSTGEDELKYITNTLLPTKIDSVDLHSLIYLTINR